MDPDFAGFEQAQARLRASFGVDVDFFNAPSVTLPSGTPVDQHGAPFDPTVAGSAVTASARVKCSVAYRSGGDQAKATAAGVFDHTHVMLISGSAAASAVSAAQTFLLREETYDVEVAKLDPMFDGVTRMLVYGRKR